MSFSLLQGRVVTASQIMLTLSPNTYPLAHIPGTCALILVRPFYGLPPPHQVMASHPSPGDNPPERWMVVRKYAGPRKNGHVKFNHLHMHQGSPLFPIFRALSRSLPLPPKTTFTPTPYVPALHFIRFRFYNNYIHALTFPCFKRLRCLFSYTASFTHLGWGTYTVIHVS